MNIVFIISLCLISVWADESVLCVSSSCKDVVCDALPDKCKIQNSTHNGLFLLSPTTCNCCEYCLENMNEGDECTVGNPANPKPKSICGAGLYCSLSPGSEFDGTCTRMNTSCIRAQDDYDNRRKAGTLGSMEVRQTCDDDGQFSSYKCIPGQTCYCIDKNENRIFGESDFTVLPDTYMQCKCSRDYVEAVALIGRELNPTEHFRCAANGDYDILQCFQDKCLCVDASDGAPTYPEQSLVNLTLISKETLNCYDQKEKGIYYKKCEEEYIQILNEVKMYEKNGYTMIFSYTFPKCDIDGTYQALQENSTHKMCVDKEGKELTAVSKYDVSANSMNCNCLRALSVITSNETPECEVNGNYSPIQCRRGICRCVDTDGNQVCKRSPCEVEEDNKNTPRCT